MKAAFGWIALEPRHGKLRRRMTVPTSDLDRCEIIQIDTGVSQVLEEMVGDTGIEPVASSV